MRILQLAATLALPCVIAVSPALAQPTEPTETPTEPGPMPTPPPGYTPVVEPQLVTPPPITKTGQVTRPPDTRLLHGIRIGYTYIAGFKKITRDTDDDGVDDSTIAAEFELKSKHSMLLGYEGMYRIVSHSWLNVILVGNVSVAGLEQSKFIPTASGLIGAEFNQSFQLGVGVNLIPDKAAPTHMIAAVGWTPKVGSIYTPVHFFAVPDPAGNHRFGATVGVTW